jgi:hypothetical protein
MDVKVNVLRLQHYVSGTAFERSDAYAEENPDLLINTEQNTVWFDNVVMATEYIGPMRPSRLCLYRYDLPFRMPAVSLMHSAKINLLKARVFP